jgi:hypothetical protein
VFAAFALNLVDCGGLLGGRLGDRPRAPPKPARAASLGIPSRSRRQAPV